MARYTGPTTRVSRRFGQYIVGSAKVLERRNFPPGQHGPKSRRKLSEYAVGLAEKQKLRFIYGLLERQFRRTFAIANRARVVPGWLTRNDEALKGTVTRLPTRDEMEPSINEQLIVEYYSRF